MASVVTVQDVINITRKEWMSFGRKFAAIQQRAVRITQPDGRKKTYIRCAHCHELFKRKEIQANHKIPVGTLASTSPEDIAAYREKMFCRVAGIEALCTTCHKAETARQRARALTRTLH